MKPKLSPKQAFTLYGFILGFVFAFFLIGLLIGKNYVVGTAAVTIPESADEPVADVTPMLDFYQQLERREETEPESRSQPDMSEGEDSSASTALPEDEDREEGHSDGADSGESESAAVESVETPTGVEDALDGDVNSDNPPDDLNDSTASISTEEEAARYTIQIGAFSTEQEARQVMLRLEAKNFPARLHAPATGESPPYFRVWVGGFSSAAEAKRLEEQLQAESFPTYLKQID